FSPEVAAKIGAADRKVMESGEVLEGVHKLEIQEGAIETKYTEGATPGRTIYYRWIRGPLRDSNGKINGVQVFALDVTAEKKAEEEIRKAKETADAANASLATEVKERKQAQDYFQSLVENVPVMVIRKDLEGRNTFCNRLGMEFWAKLLGTAVYD